MPIGELWATPTPTTGTSGQAPVVNVKTVSPAAVGDGVTDDTAAIRAAIALLATAGAGATLYFPASSGAYMISSGLNFKLLSDFTVAGAGATIRCLATMADTPRPATASPDDYGSDSSLRFDRCARFRVSGLTVDGNLSNRGGVAHAGTESFNSNVLLQGCSDVTLDGLTLAGSMTDGVTVTDNAPAGVGPCARVTLTASVRITTSRRNGLTVTGCNVLSSEATIDSVGTLAPTLPLGPGSGFDIEPDNRGVCSNIKIGGDISRCVPVSGSGAVNVSGRGATGVTLTARVHDNTGLGCNFAPYVVSTTVAAPGVAASVTVPVAATTDLTVGDHIRIGVGNEEAVIVSIGAGSVTLDHAVTYAAGAPFQSYTAQAYAMTDATLDGRVENNTGGGARVVGFGLSRLHGIIANNGNAGAGTGFGLAMFDVDGLVVEPGTRFLQNAGGGIYGNDTLDSCRRFTLIGVEIQDCTSHAANLGGSGQWLIVRMFQDPRGASYLSEPLIVGCHVFSSAGSADVMQQGVVTGTHGGRMHACTFENLSNNSTPVTGIGGHGNQSLSGTTFGTKALFEDDLHLLVPPVGGGVGGNLLVNGRVWTSSNAPPAFGSLNPYGNAWNAGDLVLNGTYSHGSPWGWKCVAAGPFWEPMGGNAGYVVQTYNAGTSPTVDWNLGKIQRINVGATMTVPMVWSNLADGDIFFLQLQYNTSNTVIWPAGVVWGTAGAPTPSAVGHLDEFELHRAGGIVTARVFLQGV